MSTSSDDYVVQKTHIEKTSTFGNTLREFDILTAWLGTTRGVVMHQDDLHGKQLDSTL
jgi:hypothetical protein